MRRIIALTKILNAEEGTARSPNLNLRRNSKGASVIDWFERSNFSTYSTFAKLMIFLFLYFQWQVFFDCNRSFILYPILFNKKLCFNSSFDLKIKIDYLSFFINQDPSKTDEQMNINCNNWNWFLNSLDHWRFWTTQKTHLPAHLLTRKHSNRTHLSFF